MERNRKDPAAKSEAAAHRKTIGLRIREARLAKGLSQSELAALVGLEAQSISKQERGVFSPGADTTLRIADACGVDPRWLRLAPLHARAEHGVDHVSEDHGAVHAPKVHSHKGGVE